jgi:hypothetical protein
MDEERANFELAVQSVSDSDLEHIEPLESAESFRIG